MSLPEQAVDFLDLHRSGQPVVLPMGWDACSAGVAHEAGVIGKRSMWRPPDDVPD